MLKVIQADILNLHIPSTDTIFPLELAEDYSVRVHSCHSPMREVQVLYDQILDAIEHDPSLAPSDIVVMTPILINMLPILKRCLAL